MSRYFLAVVLVILGCILHGTAQQKPVPMPVIDCVVEYSYGYIGDYNGPEKSDTISLNLNAIDKIRLDFDSTRTSFIPHGPFRVERVSKPDLLDWMKLVSSKPRDQVTIYVSRVAAMGEQPQQHYDITIVRESSWGVGFAVLKGTARD